MKKSTLSFPVRLVLMWVICSLLSLTNAHAATITSAASGNWSSTSTWVGGVVPVSGDDVIIAAGHTVTLVASTDIGSGSLTVTGILALSGFNITAGSLAGAGNIGTASGTPLVTVGSNNSNTTYSGIFSGTGAMLTKQGTGTLTLAGANTYTGATTINEGTLKLGASDRISNSSAMTIASGATFDLAGFIETLGSIAGAGTVTSTVTGSLTLSAGGDNSNTTFSGVIQNGTATSVALTKQGTGTLTLSGNNTYTGTTTVSTGTLKAGRATNAFGSGSAVTLANTASAILDLDNYSNTIGSLASGGATGGNVALGSGTLTVGNANSTTYSGVISGTGAISKAGTGTLTLAGANTFTGNITISNGTLAVSGTLGSGSYAGDISNAGTFTYSNTSTAQTLSGVISGTGALTKSGNSTLTLSGANTFSGAITISAGTLDVSGTLGSGSYAGNISNSGTFRYSNASTAQTLSGVISGTGALTKSGSSTLVLSGSNTYTGVTTIDAGTLKLGSASERISNSSAMTIASGATFDLAGFSETLGSLAGAGNVTSSASGTLTLTVGNSSNQTFSGIIENGSATSVALTKTGSGIMTISGANTYTGTTTVSSGSLKLGASGVISDNSALSVAATFDMGDFSETVGSIAGAGTVTSTAPPAGTLTLTAGGDNSSTTFSGVIQNGTATSVALTKAGSGTMTISGANTYTGATTISAGTLQLSTTSDRISNSSAMSIASGASFDMAGLSEALGSIAGAGTITSTSAGTCVLTCGGDNTSTTFSGVIQNGGATSVSMHKVGTGTLTLTGANTYTGTTRIVGGSVTLGSAADRLSNGSSMNYGGGQFTTGASTGFDETIGTLNIDSASVLQLGTGSHTVTYNSMGSITPGSYLVVKGWTGNYNAATGSSGTAGKFFIGSSASLTSAQLARIKFYDGASYFGSTQLSTGEVTPTNSSTFISEKTGNWNDPLTWGFSGTPTAGLNYPGGSDSARILAGHTVTLTAAVTTTETINNNGILALAANNLTAGQIIGAGTISSTGAAILTVGSKNTNFTMPGTIGSGAISLVKTGTGTLTISGSNTYTGTTTINAGKVLLSSALALGDVTGGTTVANGAVLDLNGQYYSSLEPLTINGSGIANSGAVMNSDASTATFAGLITLGSSSTITGGSGEIVITNAGSITGAYTLTLDGAIGGTIESKIETGAGTVVKTGTGTWTLSGSNTYTGTTTISQGVIKVKNTTALGTTAGNTVVSSGAVLDLNGLAYTTAEPLTINGDGISSAGAITNSQSGAASFRGPIILASPSTIATDNGAITLNATSSISGTYALTLDGTTGGTITSSIGIGAANLIKGGSGTWLLAGYSTYTGQTQVNAGTLRAGTTTAAYGSGSAIVMANTSGAVLDLNNYNNTIGSLTGGGASGGGITLGSATLTVGNTVSTTYDGIISGSGGITKTGSSTLTLTGNSTYTGTTAIDNGTISVATIANVGFSSPLGAPSTVSAATIILGTNGGNGVLKYTGSTASTDRSIQLNGDGTLDASGSGAITFASNFTAGTTSGTLTLTGTNTGGNTISGAIPNSSIATSLQKTGTGLWILSGDNTYSGSTNVVAGTLKLGASDRISNNSGLIVNNPGTFDMNGYNETVSSLSGSGTVTSTTAGDLTLTAGDGNNTTFSGLLLKGSATSVSLIKQGTGTLTLSGANTYNGQTWIKNGYISAGTINNVAGGTASSNLGAPSTIANGTIKLGDGSTTGRLIYTGSAFTTDRIFDLAGSTGGGGIWSSGSGILTVTGNLSVSAAGSKTFYLGGTNAGDNLYTGQITDGSGSVSLQKEGSGIWVLSNTGNNYAGATTLDVGTLKLGAAGVIPDGSALTINSSGTLVMNGYNETVGSLAGSGSLTNNHASTNVIFRSGGNNATTTFSGVISNGSVGTLSVEKVGSGILTHSGFNTYTGYTHVLAGTLKAGIATQAFGYRSPVTIDASAKMEIKYFDNTIGSLVGSGNLELGDAKITLGALNTSFQFDGTITDNNDGSLDKEGTGTFTLTQAIQYGGLTLIKEGVLTSTVSQTFATGGSSGGLSINTAGEFNTGSLTHTAYLLYHDGINKSVGSYGSLSSTATNKDNNFYSGTGVVNVTSDTQSLNPSTSFWNGAVSTNWFTPGNWSNNKVPNSTLDVIIQSGLSRYPEITGSATCKGMFISNGATLTISGTNTLTMYGNWTNDGTFVPNQSTVFFDLASGTQTVDNETGTFYNLTHSGAGTLQSLTNVSTLTVTNRFYNQQNSIVDLNAKNLQAGYIDGLGTFTNTASGESLWIEVNGASPLNGTFNGIIQDGNGVISFIKSNSGTQKLTGASTYSGGTTLNAGLLNLQNASAIGTGSFLINGGSFDNTTGAALTMSTNNLIYIRGSFTFVGTHDLNFGTGSVDNNGNYTVTLSSSSKTLTFGGTMTNTAYNSQTTTVNGSGNTWVLGGYNMSGTGNFSGNAFVNITGQVSGSNANLEYSGTSILTLFGTSNNYGGNTTVTSGTIKLAAAGVIPDGSATTVTGILDMNGFSETVGSIAGSGTIRSTAVGTPLLTCGGNGGSTTYSGLIENGSANTLSLTKEGYGTLTLSGNSNSYTGITTINDGTIRLAAAGTSPNSPLGTIAAGTVVNSGGALDLNGYSLSVAEPISLAGTGIYSGGAMLNSSSTLSTYSGLVTLTANASIVGGTGKITISNTGTITGSGYGLTLGGSQGGTLNSILGTGSGTLTKSGSGLWQLGGANTYSGTTAVVSGTLQLNNATALGDAAAGTTVSSGAVLDMYGVTYTAAEPLSIAGSGLSLGGAVINSAATTATFPGLLTLTAAGTIRGGTGKILLTHSGTITGNYALTLGGDAGGTVSSIIGTGTAGVTVENNGEWIFSGANTYTGITNISSGTLKLGAAGVINDNSAVTITGVLDMGGFDETVASIQGTGRVRNSASTTSPVLTCGGNNSSTTFSGIISDQNGSGSGGTTGLTKVGSGILTLTGANTYTGITTISAGTLKIGSISERISNTTAVVNNATFDLGGNNETVGSIAGTGTITSTAAGIITLTSGGNNTSTEFSGVLQNGTATTLSFIKEGNGTLTLSGNNTYTGQTTVSQGVIKLGSATALGNVSSRTLVIAGAAIDVNGTDYSSAEPLTLNGTGISSGGALFNANATGGSYAGLITLGSASSIVGGTGTINVSNIGTITGSGYGLTLGGAAGGTLASVLGTGSGTLTKADAGTWTLSGNSTYTGATTIAAGTLKLGLNNCLGSATGSTSITSGATLDLNGINYSTTEPLTMNGLGVSGNGAVINASASAGTFAGQLTLGSSALVKADNGDIHLTGDATVSGSGFDLTLDGTSSGSTFYGALTTGSGQMIKEGSGTWTLLGSTATPTNTGATTVNAGILKLGAAEQISNSSRLSNSATFDMAGNSETVASISGAGTITSSGSGSITLSSGGDGTSTTYSGTIEDNTATLAITKTGAGTLSLSGTNTYDGTTTVSAGVIEVLSSGALGSTTGSTTVSSGAALNLNGSAPSGNEALSLSGSGISNGGALRVTSGNLTWPGTITLAAAARINAEASTSLLINNAASVNSSGIGLTVGGSGNTTVSGVMALGSGTVTKDGSGTLIVSGANTYTGATAVSAGVLNVQNNTGTGTTAGGVTVSSGAELQLQGGITVGAEALTINNTGVASGGSLRNISGDNTWGGTITLSTNPPRINSDAGTLTLSAITASNRAVTFGGSGNITVTGTITTGTGTLTKDGSGTLTLSGSNTYTGSTTVSAGILAMRHSNALGTTAGSTSVTSGASLHVDGSAGVLTVGAEALTLNGTGVSNDGALRNIAGNNTWGTFWLFGSGTTQVQSDAGSIQVPSLTIDNGKTFKMVGNRLRITGAFSNTAGGTLDATNGGIELNGSAAQTFNPGNMAGPINNFYINNTFVTSPQVTTGATFSVNTLHLTKGVVNIGAYNLNADAINNPGLSTSYVRADWNVGGRLNLTLDNGESDTLPVGKTSFNRLVVTNNTGAQDVFGLNIQDEVFGRASCCVPMTSKKRVKRTWNIYKNTANGGSGVDLEFFWNSGEESTSPSLLSDPKLYHYNEGSWNWDIQTAGTYTYNAAARTLKYQGYVGSFSPFAIGGEGSVELLPVTWLQFNCNRISSEKVAVTWSTGMEENTEAFYIERKTGNSDFANIGKVDAAGNSFETRNYQFIDNDAPLKQTFYRVKQTDKNGKSSYTSICESNSGADAGEGIQVSPNPANAELNVAFADAEGEFICNLYDVTGKHVLMGTSVSGRCNLKTDALYPGVYTLKIQGEGYSSSKKIVIHY